MLALELEEVLELVLAVERRLHQNSTRQQQLLQQQQWLLALNYFLLSLSLLHFHLNHYFLEQSNL